MIKKLDKPVKKSIDLIEVLKKVNWNLDYGQIRLQIRDYKVTLIAIERTIKVD